MPGKGTALSFADPGEAEGGSAPAAEGLLAELVGFQEFGTPTTRSLTEVVVGGAKLSVPTFVNEFWTARQRAAHSLHEVSYRACFKPQLPRFFIERLTRPGDVVYDPFSGRGTTALEAALLGRIPWACDINPLSRTLSEPRLTPPSPAAVRDRLASLRLEDRSDLPEELLAFYHPKTLQAIVNLRDYFLRREADGALDATDRWIRMVAINRLTGHSSGFFSVYSMPPNQAVSVESQRRINERRGQTPPFRDVRDIIHKKTRTLLRDLTETDADILHGVQPEARILTGDCRDLPGLPEAQVQLIVTSPPFLDIVNYRQDNWLRCWFVGVDAGAVPIMQFRRLEDWMAAMTEGFEEHRRVLKPGGWIAFEVGEVRKGSLLLEQAVVECGVRAGLAPELVLINDQDFTKTSNCWGIGNRHKGTNTNRIVLFRKPL